MKANYSKKIGAAPNYQQLMNMAQKMQEDMDATKAELEAREYDASAGGGMVTVKMNGKHEVISIDIKPEIVDPDDIETLSDILVAAVNEAVKRVDETAEEEMKKITGNVNMPPMF